MTRQERLEAVEQAVNDARGICAAADQAWTSAGVRRLAKLANTAAQRARKIAADDEELCVLADRARRYADSAASAARLF
jgi:hypothetical protein